MPDTVHNVLGTLGFSEPMAVRPKFHANDNSKDVLNVVPLDIQIDPGTEEPQVVMRYDDAVSFAFTLLQAQSLSQTIQHVLTSGRPVCPLCHMPLDGGPHACVKQNGHREIIQIEEGGEGEEEEEE